MYGYVLYTVNADGSLGEDISPNISHSYFNSEWGDLLTGFKGNTITYDEIGNPLNYYNGSSYTFTWDGRRLATAVKGSNSMSFAYNSDGLRVTKTVNGVVTTYYYQGSLLIAEETNSQILVYIYDTNGSPIGFKYRGADYASETWDAYAYEKNLQGDIVAVYDISTGNKLIAYKYNAWGVCTTSYYNGGSSTTATKNPFKYRGYYYDSDLGLYYLQSRYYDQNTGRFISPDFLMSGANGSLHGFNLYVYCFNNPISYTDSQGNWPTKEELQQLAGEVWGRIVDGAEAVAEAVTNFVNDIAEDFENYDPNNTSEQTVLDSNYFSVYKGVFVIRTNGDRSGSFGVIFLTRESNYRDCPEDVVRHEYGHTKQLEQLGVLNYALCIGLPSWQEWGTGSYYCKPWEVTADIYGGVQSRTHSQEEVLTGLSYLNRSKRIGPLAWLHIN